MFDFDKNKNKEKDKIRDYETWREMNEVAKLGSGYVEDRRTEAEKERDAIRLQEWQRAKFARELGFSPDTKDSAELAAIDWKYEEMLKGVNEWNERERKKLDEILKELRGDKE